MRAGTLRQVPQSKGTENTSTQDLLTAYISACHTLIFPYKRFCWCMVVLTCRLIQLNVYVDIKGYCSRLYSSVCVCAVRRLRP